MPVISPDGVATPPPESYDLPDEVFLKETSELFGNAATPVVSITSESEGQLRVAVLKL
jgi:hypothetical protein